MSVIVNGKKLSAEEYAAWSKERVAFLDEMDCGLDAMLRDGRSVRTMTDDDFWRNRKHIEEADPVHGPLYRKRAEQMGCSTSGKYYLPGLARFPGDPEAWVSNRGDVQRVCESRGWNSEGEVTVRSTPRDEDLAPVKPVRLAPDIVNKTAVEYLRADPKLREKPLEEVKEMVIDKHGRPE